MSLRLRLTLAFLLLASLLAMVGFVAVGASRRIEYQVSLLEQASVVEVHNASAMALSLQRAKTATEELVTELYRLRVDGPQPGDDERSLDDIEAEIREALAAFELDLERSRAAVATALRLAEAGDAAALTAERGELVQWLDPIAAEFASLERETEEFLRLAARDASLAHRHLNEVLGPHFREQLLPLVRAFREDAVEELSDEVNRIAAAARAAADTALATSLGAGALALLLGFTLSRSIVRPILALGRAAERLGRGDLASRVEIAARGELGDLVATFNRMAEDLSATTVSRSYLRNVIESMAGALIITDAAGRIVSVNRAALALLGYQAESELIGEPFGRVYDSSGAAGEAPAMSRLQGAGSTRGSEENLARKDGSQVAVAISGAALRDERGRLQGFVAVAQDLTERRQIEGRLRTLLREVNHRVKNNLQVVSSLLELHSGYLADSRAREVLLESHSRVRSMALVHEQLRGSPDVDSVDVGAYIEKLATQLFRSYGVASDRVALRFAIEKGTLDINQALACGLIINELLSNALKHGFPGDAAGEVRLELRETAGNGLTLLVADNGRGLAEDFDLQQVDSLGLNLVTTMVKQLRGKIVVASNGGTEVRIAFPSAGDPVASVGGAIHAG